MAPAIDGLLNELESCSQHLLESLMRESNDTDAILQQRQVLLDRLRAHAEAGVISAAPAEQAQRLLQLERQIAQAGALWRAKLMARLTQCQQRRGVLQLACASAGPSHNRVELKA